MSLRKKSTMTEESIAAQSGEREAVAWPRHF